MALMSKTLQRLLPPGLAWIPSGTFTALVEALGVSMARVRDYLQAIVTESIPATAVGTLPDWHVTYGLRWDPAQAVVNKQMRVAAAHSSIGGQSLEYLDSQVKKEFPGVTIHELPEGGPWGMTYEVVGSVYTVSDATRLQGMIDRIGPLHLQPTIDVRILSNEVSAVTGMAITGRARTGRPE
jgi:hypothetical protein